MLNKYKHKKPFLVSLLVAGFFGAAFCQQPDSASNPLHYSLSAGSTVEAGFGRVLSNLWVAPRLSWQPTQRLTLRGGFAAEASLLPTPALHGLAPQSLAPRRQGSRMASLWAEAVCKPNDRLWLWAAVAHTRGQFQPLWLDRALPIQATAFSGGLGYQLPGGSFLELDFHFVHDRYATLPDAFGPLPYSYPFPYPYPYSHPFYLSSYPYHDSPF